MDQGLRFSNIQIELGSISKPYGELSRDYYFINLNCGYCLSQRGGGGIELIAIQGKNHMEGLEPLEAVVRGSYRAPMEKRIQLKVLCNIHNALHSLVSSKIFKRGLRALPSTQATEIVRRCFYAENTSFKNMYGARSMTKISDSSIFEEALYVCHRRDLQKMPNR
ncbi:hypothetical protein CAPTEDRAFT_215311 [Capitella teleta]|uniref:Uncharacterized protein n=1 Tax=Capitella teleta TaxID=283909 RepID=R7UVE7_CAPTE|nr:hypothetical protein CAPTEDRAFT_215311 [Capitella teleta]|eukprot:ELU10212.1 hypothetical protein CAPTEDRAFT_215311 [Capitella teleta]